MNPKQFAVLIVFAGVVAQLPAQQPHCHEDFGYSPPTLFNFASPSITGNTYTEGFYDGVVVASLPAASISVGVEEPPPNTRRGSPGPITVHRGRAQEREGSSSETSPHARRSPELGLPCRWPSGRSCCRREA